MASKVDLSFEELLRYVGKLRSDGDYSLRLTRELFNGATYDEERNNTEGVLLASAARTTTASSPNLTNYNADGVIVYLNVTVASGTGGVRPVIQSLDPASGQWSRLNIAPAFVTATGLYIYELSPGASGVEVGAGKVQQRTSGKLPRTWRVVVEVGDATSYTYSIGYAS